MNNNETFFCFSSSKIKKELILHVSLDCFTLTVIFFRTENI